MSDKIKLFNQKSNQNTTNASNSGLQSESQPDESQSNVYSCPTTSNRVENVMPKIFLSESRNILIGQKFETPENLILNQFVDNPRYSSVTITGGTAEKSCARKFWLRGSPIFVGFLICASTVLIVLLNTPNETSSKGLGEDATENYTYLKVPRTAWSDVKNPPFEDLPVQPARLVIVGNTEGHFCDSFLSCIKSIKNTESWSLERGFITIGYHFLIGGDGRIYENRPWGKEGYGLKMNCNSIGVAFTGDFNNDNLTEPMVNAFNILMIEGQTRGALSKAYKVFSLKQLIPKDAPGSHIWEAMKEWPHWSAYVTEEDRMCLNFPS